MADSYRQQRLKELSGGGGYDASAVNSSDANIPYRQRRLMEMGYLQDTRPSTELRNSLPDTVKNAMTGDFQNTTLGQSGINPTAQSIIAGATGIKAPIKPSMVQPTPTSINDNIYSQRKSEIQDGGTARDFFGNLIYDNVIAPFSYGANYAAYGNPIGQTISRLGNTAASVTGPAVAPKPTTGSELGDKITDVAGTIAGFGFNPAGVGVAGQNLFSGPYKAADNILMTRGGQAAQNALGGAASKILSPGTANNLANQALRGSIAGSIQGAATSQLRDESGSDVLKNAAIGGALGGLGDVAISGAGAALRAKFPSIYERFANRIEAEEPTISSTEQALNATNRTRVPFNEVNANSEGVPAEHQVLKWLSANRDAKRAAEGLPIYQKNIAPQKELPTTARIGTNPNPYRQKFENLMKVANDTEFTPGREEDELGVLWSTMAEKGDPQGVSELIDLAYPSNRIPPDLVSKARNYQQKREKYGVPLPINSISKQNLPGQPNSAMRIFADEAERLRTLRENPEATNNAIAQSDVAPPTNPLVDNPIKSPDEVIPTGTPIINPSDVMDTNGLGFIAGSRRISKYDNLSTSTKSQLVSRQKREPFDKSKVANRLYTKLVDDLNPIQQFTEYADDVLERVTKADKDPYKLALSSRGSDMTAKQITTEAFVNNKGEVVGGSLKDALQDVPYQNYVDFEDYLINKHAMTRAGREEKVFRDELKWTPEKGAQIINDYERLFPQFREASEKVYQYNRNLIEHWLVEPGMISQKQADAYFEANPFYVPNKRYFTDLEKGGRGFSRSSEGFGNQSVPVKKYGKGGSQRKIISPIESIIENTDAYVKAANRNRVMQEFVSTIKEKPDDFKDFVEIVDQSKPNAKVKNKIDVDEELQSEDGVDGLIAEVTNDFNKATKNKKEDLTHDNIVRTLIEGEPVYVKFHDPDLLNAMLAIGPDASKGVIRAIGKVTGFMKTLTTGINPVFNLTRNIFRDIPQSYVQSKTTNNPMEFTADLFASAIDIIKNRDVYQQYKSLGGGHSSSISADRNMLARSKNAVLPNTKRNLPGAAYRAFEDAMNVVESFPRLAEYKRVLKSDGDTDALLKEALYAAQEITVNFKRRGAMVKELDKIFPYMNAAVQGLDKSIRTFRSNPVQATTKAFAAITLPTLIMYAVNHDDPNYQKLSNRTKDNFILIPKGDGTFWKIAKPQELGTIFSDIPERLLRKFKDDDPEAFKDFATQLRNNFTPPGVSGFLKDGSITDRLTTGLLGDTILGPLANLRANKDYADRPIVPGTLEKLSPGLQSDAKTSALAKALGESTNTSPKEIDYLIKQYTGVLGQIGLPAMSPAQSGNNILQSIGNAFKQNVTADPVYDTNATNDFYEYKDQLDQANFDKELKPFPEWYQDSARKKFNRLSKDMSKIRKQMRAIEGNTSMDKTQRREQLRVLQQQVNEIAEAGSSLAKEKNIPSK